MKLFDVPAHAELLVFDIDNTLYRHPGYQEHQVRLLVDRFAEQRSIAVEEARMMIEDAKRREADRLGLATTSMGNAMVALGIPLSTNATWRSELFHPEEFLVTDEKLVSVVTALAKSYRLAAVTNNSHAIGVRTLETLGIGTAFEAAIGLDTVGESKPSTAPFERALGMTGIAAERAVSIGDRYDVDIVPARSIGMGGILVDSMEDVYRLPHLLGSESKS